VNFLNLMSDEFIELATKEINQELSNMDDILNLCKNDDDVILKASNFQRHTHKIKGLAPMMGQDELGEIASQLDFILKQVIDGKNISFFIDLVNCIAAMKNVMNSSEYDLTKIKERILAISANLRS